MTKREKLLYEALVRERALLHIAEGHSVSALRCLQLAVEEIAAEFPKTQRKTRKK